MKRKFLIAMTSIMMTGGINSAATPPIEGFKYSVDKFADIEILRYRVPEHTQISIVYAHEADVLNMALFGVTAKQWRENNPELKGNIRDYASINELK